MFITILITDLLRRPPRDNIEANIELLLRFVSSPSSLLSPLLCLPLVNEKHLILSASRFNEIFNDYH